MTSPSTDPSILTATEEAYNPEGPEIKTGVNLEENGEDEIAVSNGDDSPAAAGSVVVAAENNSKVMSGPKIPDLVSFPIGIDNGSMIEAESGHQVTCMLKNQKQTFNL